MTLDSIIIICGFLLGLLTPTRILYKIIEDIPIKAVRDYKRDQQLKQEAERKADELLRTFKKTREDQARTSIRCEFQEVINIQ